MDELLLPLKLFLILVCKKSGIKDYNSLQMRITALNCITFKCSEKMKALGTFERVTLLVGAW
jgi:hypothetical protein